MMKPSTTDEVLDLLDAATTCAAVGAGIELGLFWLLDREPLATEEIAARLAIPRLRCGFWLQLLARAGLLQRDGDAFQASPAARATILGTYAQSTWTLLAEEARERLEAVTGLPLRLHATPPSEGTPDTISSTYDRMATDASAAARFTRMLYEVHLPLARQLAASLDLRDVRRLMDLGGGSGVVSVEIARRHPSLAATVVDVATVCDAGREIVDALGMAGRVSFHAADVVRDPLPRGFNAVLECDVNVYSDELFRKIRDALEPGGRYLIVDEVGSSRGEAPPSRLHWALTRSLIDPWYAPPSLPEIRAMLERAGFCVVRERRLEPPPAGGSQLADDLVVIEARRD